MQLPPNSLLASRFRIVRLLGRGGMGEVYEARHEVLQRRLAIKRMRLDALVDKHAESLFVREARAASRVEHPNVAFVYDFGRDEFDFPYMAMEFVDGPSLDKVLAESGKPSVEVAVELLGQIASALAAAHALGVAHLDLKPGNVAFAGPVQRQRVKVIDFGLARTFAAKGTVESIIDDVRGSPHYMSPEQFFGRDKLDGRSDVYSFGVLAFELLCGQRPFSGNLPKLAMAHQEDAPPAPSSLAKLPPGLEQLVLACLEKRPEARPPDGAALVDALREVAAELARPGLQSQTTIAFGATTPLASEPPRRQRPTGGRLAPAATSHDATLLAGAAGVTMSHARARALDELVLVLRDRGATEDGIEIAAARKARAEDEQLGFEAQRDDLTLQIARAQQTAAERESRLRRAYVGLERRLTVLRSAAQDGVIRGTLDELGTRIRQLESAAGEHIAQLASRAEAQAHAADAAAVEVARQRAALIEAIRAVRPKLPLDDTSLLSLLVRAGV